MEQKNVEVFKTNLRKAEEAEKVLALLRQQFPHYQANVDLTDCDKILRIESCSGNVDGEIIKELISEAGYLGEVLPD